MCSLLLVVQFLLGVTWFLSCIEQLCSRKSYAVAARLLLDYTDVSYSLSSSIIPSINLFMIKEVEEAITMLLEGGVWDEALRIVSLHPPHSQHLPCTPPLGLSARPS